MLLSSQIFIRNAIMCQMLFHDTDDTVLDNTIPGPHQDYILYQRDTK